MSRPEFDDIRAYIATLNRSEVLGYLPCVTNDLANTAVEAATVDQIPELQAARRVHVAYLAAVIGILHRRLVELAAEPVDHSRCDGFVTMLNQAKLRLVTAAARDGGHEHGGGG